MSLFNCTSDFDNDPFSVVGDAIGISSSVGGPVVYIEDAEFTSVGVL